MIEALNALRRPCQIDLFTDSTYVMKGITEWITGWRRKGWKTSSGKAVKNQDLWQQLDQAQQRHDVKWHWVKGHSNHPDNDRADALARQGIST